VSEPGTGQGQAGVPGQLLLGGQTRDVSRFELERALRGVNLPFATRGVVQALLSRMDADGTTGSRPELASEEQLARDLGIALEEGSSPEQRARRKSQLQPVKRHLQRARELGFLRRDGRSYPGRVAPWVACVPWEMGVADVPPSESGMGVADVPPPEGMGVSRSSEWGSSSDPPARPARPKSNSSSRAGAHASARDTGEAGEVVPVIVEPSDRQPDSLAAYAERLHLDHPGASAYPVDQVAAALADIADRAGLEPAATRAVLRAIVARRKPGNLPAYVRRVSDFDQYRAGDAVRTRHSASGAAAAAADAAAALRERLVRLCRGDMDLAVEAHAAAASDLGARATEAEVLGQACSYVVDPDWRTSAAI